MTAEMGIIPRSELLEDRTLLSGFNQWTEVESGPMSTERVEPDVLTSGFQSPLQNSHTSIHDSHGPAGVDVPFGVFSPAEIAAFESVEWSSSLSTQTVVPNPDGGHASDVLTFVLDFKESTQGSTFDIFANEVTTFDVTSFGFSAGDFNTVANAVLAVVEEDYFDELVGTVAGPTGRDLVVDFIIGDIGTAPAGVTEFYYVQIGTGVAGPHSGGTLGVAGGSVVRKDSGSTGSAAIGDVVSSVFTDAIGTLGGLTPSNALTSGNLALTARHLNSIAKPVATRRSTSILMVTQRPGRCGTRKSMAVRISRLPHIPSMAIRHSAIRNSNVSNSSGNA